MASDTVPAAPDVPEPPAHAPSNGIPNLPGAPARPVGGFLAGTLAAVEPARPTFDLTPTTGDDTTGVNTLTEGGSSAAYHDGNPDQKDATGGKTNTSGQEKSIVRAWLLAGAERWRKGADARNKALDIKKAKATALQVKESRTVNRSEKIVGGGTNSATSGKTDTGKTTKTQTSGPGGPKNNAGGGGGKGSGGGSGSGAGGGRGAGSGSGSGTGGGRGTKGGDSGTGKATKTDHSKSGGGSKTPASSGGVSGGGKGGSSGGQGSSGKPGKDTASHNGSGGKSPKPQTTSTCGDASGISMTKDKKPNPAKDTSGDNTATKAPKPSSTKNAPQPGPGAGPKGGPGAGGAGGTAGGKAPANTPGGTKPVDMKKNPDTKGGDKTTPKPAPGKPDLKKTPGTPDPKTTQVPTASGPTVNTQATREAGYRDGTRVGKVKAHAGAYKDGVKDGYKDTSAAAAQEKTRLDKAHQQRKQQPHPTAVPPAQAIPPKPAVPPKPTTPPVRDPRTILMKPKETPVNPTASSADYHPPQAAPGQGGQSQANPVKVDGIDASHLYLGDGAARQYISRGEVRRLKDFERVFTTKAENMTRLGDATKGLQANAEARAKAVTHLMEQARIVEGGADLVADLLRLQEATQVQIGNARELHKRTVRGADNTRVLLANAETRYGGMYQAVVDSPLTQHAEASYYRK